MRLTWRLPLRPSPGLQPLDLAHPRENAERTSAACPRAECSPRPASRMLPGWFGRLRSPLGWVLVVLGTAAVLRIRGGGFENLLRRLLGAPPLVQLAEVYAAETGEASFDHSLFDGVLRKHVDGRGRVDYAALKRDSAALDAYIEALGKAPFEDLPRDEKLALLINAYNAFTLRLILDFYPVASIQDIPEAQRWQARRWNIGGKLWSLDQIEHEQIRPRFREPRIHFALVCAAKGCPRLRNEAYRAGSLEEQLEDQTRYLHSHEQWLSFDAARGKLHLTQLYRWYGSDFEQVSGTVLDQVARSVPALRASLASGTRIQVEWLDYDWSLNAKEVTP